MKRYLIFIVATILLLALGSNATASAQQIPRMVGGGSVTGTEGTAFFSTALSCNPSLMKQSLVVSWNGNLFILQSVDDANCGLAPAPLANFSQLAGDGLGLLITPSGTETAIIQYSFIDGGWLASNDLAGLFIYDINLNLIFGVEQFLNFGNLWAIGNITG